MGTPPLEVQGADGFAQACAAPPALTDADVDALVARLPSAEERERQFWAPLALDLRAASVCERSRSDSLLALIARHNQIVRDAR